MRAVETFAFGRAESVGWRYLSLRGRYLNCYGVYTWSRGTAGVIRKYPTRSRWATEWTDEKRA